MRKIVEVTEVAGEGLDSLLGEQVLLLCANYFYTGKLAGVSTEFVLLESPSIVYETGPWTEETYRAVQKLHIDKLYVQRGFIESFGLSK
jgi:hypothetical protein